MQNRFADAKLALRGAIEVTRRDGLSFLKDNIPYGSGHVELQFGWDLCLKFWSNNLIFEQSHKFNIVGYISRTPTGVIAWHMQKLSSTHG